MVGVVAQMRCQNVYCLAYSIERVRNGGGTGAFDHASVGHGEPTLVTFEMIPKLEEKKRSAPVVPLFWHTGQ